MHDELLTKINKGAIGSLVVFGTVTIFSALD